jgi:hypothetical protein
MDDVEIGVICSFFVEDIPPIHHLPYINYDIIYHPQPLEDIMRI